MCGRFHHHRSKMQGWADTLSDWPLDLPEGDFFPTQQIACSAGHGLQSMRWGLINANSKEFKTKASTHNARIETIDQRWTFKSAWANKQRCLIPMSGYYEFVGEKGNKQAIYISDPDIGGLVVAGLWECWNESHFSCTMITRQAQQQLAEVHPRMLVFLTPVTAKAWLSGEMNKSELAGLELPTISFSQLKSDNPNKNNKGQYELL